MQGEVGRGFFVSFSGHGVITYHGSTASLRHDRERDESGRAALSSGRNRVEGGRCFQRDLVVLVVIILDY